MLGFKKKKIELKSVEDYIRDDSGQTPKIEARITSKDSGAGTMKQFVVPLIGILAVLVVAIAVFVKISGLSSEVAALKGQINEAGVQDLKSRVAALDGKLEKVGKESTQLRENIARLEKELVAAKARQARVQAAAKKPVPAPVEKKKKSAKPAKPRA